jgi:hypothetical protein
LLKSYYADVQPEQRIEKVMEKRIDPLDIDTTGYHAELAHNMMLKEQGLVELLQKNHLLVTGIDY